jgi:hypothetical protein
MFSVTINFNVDNSTSSFFTIVGNGNNYGSFEFEDLPIAIGPLPGDNETPYEFIVFDNDNLDCQAAIELGIINCGPFCGFDNPVLDFVTCQSNVTAIVTLDFDFFNVTNAAFDLFNDEGNQIGSWLYTSLPVTLPNFLVNGNEEIVLQVCDNDNELCCETFTFPPIDCNPNNCEIFNMEATPICEGDSFTVQVNLEVENPAAASFELAGNGINYGTFLYNSLPITVGPFAANTGLQWEFIARDAENENCSDFVDVGIVNCPMSCVVTSLNAEAIECTSDSTYQVIVNATVENGSEEGFTLYTSGEIIGQFDYADLPLTLENFPGSGNFFDVITLCDNDDQSCCATEEFEALRCAGCVIYGMEVDLLPCNGEDEFFAVLNFQHQNTGTQGFQVGGNGNVYGQFEYADLPVTIGPLEANGTTFYEFVVLDLESIGCLNAIEVGTVECEQICGFTDISVTELTCSGDNLYELILNFNHSGTSNGFDLYANGALFGVYSYEVLPLTIVNFSASGNAVEVIEICDNDNPDCCIVFEFDAIDCDFPCEILDLVVEPVECTSDSAFRADIDFMFSNTEGNGFDIYAGELYLGFFEKEEGALSVNGIPSISDLQNSITVCASNDTLCCTTIEFTGLDCMPDTCRIYDIELVNQECESDSTIVAVINFSFENSSSNSFIVYDGVQNLGFYDKEEGPVTVDGIRLDDTGEKTLTICANDTPNCCENFTFITPDCNPDTCVIEIISIFPIECTSDSTFRVNIGTQSSGLENENFDVYRFGESIGFFQAENGAFSIQNFPSTTGEMNQIVICPSDNLSCCDTVEFEGLICDPELCLIDDILVDPTECTSDSTFTAVIDFLYQNTGSDTFDIFNADGYFGTFLKLDGPLALEQFPANSNGQYVITICAQDVEGCCATEEFEGPVCSPDCNIFNLVAEPIECESPTTFIVEVDFDFVNLDSSGVDVYTGTTYLGFYETDNLPFQIVGFPLPITEFAEITICQSDDTLCCTTVQFDPLNCAEEFCDIFDLEYTLSECDTAGNFFVTLDFEFINPGEAGFNVVGNGVNYGNYSYESIPLTIGPLPADPELEYEFLVQDLEDNTCFDFVDVGIVECEVNRVKDNAGVEQIKLMYQSGKPYIFIPDSDLKLRLFRANGQLVFQDQGMPDHVWYSPECNGLVSGIYFIELSNDQKRYIGKLVVTE